MYHQACWVPVSQVHTICSVPHSLMWEVWKLSLIKTKHRCPQVTEVLHVSPDATTQETTLLAARDLSCCYLTTNAQQFTVSFICIFKSKFHDLHSRKVRAEKLLLLSKHQMPIWRILNATNFSSCWEFCLGLTYEMNLMIQDLLLN